MIIQHCFLGWGLFTMIRQRAHDTKIRKLLLLQVLYSLFIPRSSVLLLSKNTFAKLLASELNAHLKHEELSQLIKKSHNILDSVKQRIGKGWSILPRISLQKSNFMFSLLSSLMQPLSGEGRKALQAKEVLVPLIITGHLCSLSADLYPKMTSPNHTQRAAESISCCSPEHK